MKTILNTQLEKFVDRTGKKKKEKNNLYSKFKFNFYR